jgi:hypothetical protein
VIPTSVVAAAVGSVAVSAFQGDFPTASVIESPSHAWLKHASGFEATGFGDGPEAAARGFLAKYGAAFGIGPRQELVKRGAPARGRPGPVRFERRIDKLPVFDADVVVGIDANDAIVLVNAADVPADVEGHFRLSRNAATQAARGAIPRLEMADVPRAQRGWRAAGQAVRPVWRVHFVAIQPPGAFRVDVDAETGKVLFRTNLRLNGTRAAAADRTASGAQPLRVP